MPSSEPGAATAEPTRKTPLVLLWVAGALLVTRIGTGIYEHRRTHHPPDLVGWCAVKDAEAESRRTGKPIMYDFTADWCPPCKKMKREVFGDRESADEINDKFIPVYAMDDGPDADAVEQLQKRYGIKAFPTLVIVSPDGSKTEASRGYGGKERTLQFLRDAHKTVKPSPKG